MTWDQFHEQHPAVVAARARIARVRDEMERNNRWGDARRFQGRSAGLRLQRLDKAFAALSRAFDRAQRDYARVSA